LELIARNVQRALDAQFARCESDRSCAAAYPTLRSDFAALMTRLTERPVTVTAADGASVTVNADALAMATHISLLTDKSISQLPYLIHLASLGRWDDLLRAANAAPQGDTFGLAMSIVIRCAEPWARFEPSAVARNAPTSFDTPLQMKWATIQSAACPYVPQGVTAAIDAQPVRSDAPVLFLVGGADPQDPIENVADATVLFPHSGFVVAPGHGHGVAQFGCMGTIVSAFVRAASVAGLDTSCVAHGGVPLTPFRLPSPAGP